jgi:hypothetical protein
MRTNLDAFSGGSPFPVVDATISSVHGRRSKLRHGAFFHASISVHVTSTAGTAASPAAIDDLILDAKSLAMCSEFPVADPYRTWIGPVRNGGGGEGDGSDGGGSDGEDDAGKGEDDASSVEDRTIRSRFGCEGEEGSLAAWMRESCEWESQGWAQ